MDFVVFLGDNFIFNICVDFNRYFFWFVLNIGFSFVEGGGEGDLTFFFNRRVDIIRYLRYLIFGIIVMSIFLKFM